MGTINGYVVTARRPSGRGFVVLASKSNGDGFDYIVAYIASIAAHFFDGGFETTDFDAATAAFREI